MLLNFDNFHQGNGGIAIPLFSSDSFPLASSTKAQLKCLEVVFISYCCISEMLKWGVEGQGRKHFTLLRKQSINGELFVEGYDFFLVFCFPLIHCGVGDKHCDNPLQIATVVLIQTFQSRLQRKHWFTVNAGQDGVFLKLQLCRFAAPLLGWILHVKHSLGKQGAYNKLQQHPNPSHHLPPQRDLSCCVDGDARRSITYCAVCPWSWRHVYTTHIPLCLLSGFIPLREISRSQSDQNRESTFSPRLPVWMHKVTGAVTGNLGCKSADGDLIKRARPLGWEGWMGHAPLSSQTLSGLDFGA